MMMMVMTLNTKANYGNDGRADRNREVTYRAAAKAPRGRAPGGQPYY